MRLPTLAILPLLLASGLQAGSPWPNDLPRVADSRLDSALARTWRGIKSHNIDPWDNGLVHRPYSEYPGDAVSEGQGYGMLTALYENDQATFDSIWRASERSMAVSQDGYTYYDWWRCADGGTSCTGPTFKNGPATDADQDIALALIFADSLVRKGAWEDHQAPDGSSYGERAQMVLNAIWTLMVQDGKYLRPGNWGGSTMLNVGYFSPAWYRVFAEVDTASSHDWNAVVEQCYTTLALTPGIDKGLVPDWSTATGHVLSNGPGYNAYANGQWMYKDAIRILWRLSLDWLWFGESRAKTILDSALAFVGSPSGANFYQLDGTPVPVSDTFTLGSGLWRSRNEHSHLTLAMWACAALVSGDDATAAEWADSLLAYLPDDSLTWGIPSELDLADRTGSLPNEVYFDQFLAWFGTSVLAGRFSNLLADLSDPLAGIPVAWLQEPTTSPIGLDLADGPWKATGILNKPATWSVTITSLVDSSRWSVSGRSDTLAPIWKGRDDSGQAFPLGWCRVDWKAGKLPTVTSLVWLAHHDDPRQDSGWVLIDDFSEGEPAAPLAGSFSDFDNAVYGGNAELSFAVSDSADSAFLRAPYDLGTGGYQYAGLEWSFDSWSRVGLLTGVRYRARAAAPTVVELFVVQSDIEDEDYARVLDTVGTEWRTFTHDFADFAGRLSTTGTADLSLATSLRWNLQVSPPNASATNDVEGTLDIDDLAVAGPADSLVDVPSDSLAMPDELPVALAAAARPSLSIRSRAGALELDLPLAGRLLVLDARGRTLLGRDLQAGKTIVPVPGSGLRLVVLRETGGALKTGRIVLP